MTVPQVRVTVGLPVYNDPEGLHCSIPTVLGQSWAGELRLVIVDDGSTDNTPDVIRDFAERNANIEVVTHPRNLGRPVARNRILEEAGDDYLAWIDSDDLWTPRKLERQMAALLEEDPSGQEPVLCTTAFRWVYRDRGQETVKVPEIEGDQLRNALTGTLHPYLWALLGPATAFREVGGFDERLPRRQDFEFFVRFLANGGRVIRTDPDTPLCTYMKTDVGRSPREIATANEVIRRKHSDIYRRYGPRFSLEGRRKQHLLVARFHRHNHQRARSAVSGARARVFDPLLWLLAPADALSRLARMARRLARRVRQRTRRLGSWARQGAGVAKRHAVLRARPLRRRAAAGKSLLRDGHVISAVGRVLWPKDQAAKAVTVALRSARQQDIETTIDHLIALLGPEPCDGERDVWLALEEAYRLAGNLWSAERSLLAGLERCPDERRLMTRRVELLSLRREWEACIQLWVSLDGQSADEVYAITHTRVARAYQQVGRLQEARDIAELGLARWPNDERLQDEYQRVQAACTDWSTSLLAVSASQDEPCGHVTSLGFLEGVDGPISGRLSDDLKQQREVDLLVNGAVVASTTAQLADDHQEPGEPTFALACDDLAKFLGDGDLVELRSASGPIGVGSGATGLRVRSEVASRSDELLRKIAAGHRFTKFGKLRSGNTSARKTAILDLFEEVQRLLEPKLGLNLSPFYGNLLGSIREHDFLPHDIGGFDIGYLSGHGTPEAVREEFCSVCRYLLERGYHLTLEPYSAMIRRSPGEPIFLDLNFAWVSDAGDLALSYGWRYEPVRDIDAFRRPRRTALADRLVAVPGNAEDVLSQIYGPGWLVPDQGFQLEAGLQRDERYLLTSSELEELRDIAPDLVRIRSEESIES